jgi:hypothetical protein
MFKVLSNFLCKKFLRKSKAALVRQVLLHLLHAPSQMLYARMTCGRFQQNFQLEVNRYAQGDGQQRHHDVDLSAIQSTLIGLQMIRNDDLLIVSLKNEQDSSAWLSQRNRLALVSFASSPADEEVAVTMYIKLRTCAPIASVACSLLSTHSAARPCCLSFDNIGYKFIRWNAYSCNIDI